MRIADKIKPGMDALSVAKVIFEHHNILLLNFRIYQCEEKPHFAEVKVKNPKARRSVAEALQHTSDFTEPLVVVQRIEDFANIESVLSNLKRIEPEKTTIASYIDPDEKEQIYIHEALKLTSRVETKDGSFHIPLLDLDISTDEIPHDFAFPYLREMSLHLGVNSGAIVNSGKSYHLYGLELMNNDAWKTFMVKAGLLDRIDRRWLAHRMLDKQANIRISPKWGKIPEVAYVF